MQLHVVCIIRRDNISYDTKYLASVPVWSSSVFRRGREPVANHFYSWFEFENFKLIRWRSLGCCLLMSEKDSEKSATSWKIASSLCSECPNLCPATSSIVSFLNSWATSCSGQAGLFHGCFQFQQFWGIDHRYILDKPGKTHQAPSSFQRTNTH